MTPQGQDKSFVTSRIPGSENEWKQKNFPTDYCGLIHRLAPCPPASLIKSMEATNQNISKKKDEPGRGKAKIMLRISSENMLPHASRQEFLRVEKNDKHVSVFAPDEKLRRNPALAPKVYSFDSVFTESTTQKAICNSTLPDVIQAVLQGADGSVFCYGQSNLGKTQVLFGQDDTTENIGVLPCAIKWLYHCIDQLNKQQGTTFSVGVSAFEVHGRSEKLKDLLSKHCEDPPSGTLCIGEDPLMGSQLQHQCKVQASTVEKAGYLLDAALASRSCSGSRNTAEGRRHSHMVFSLHVHCNKLSDSKRSGFQSRLHFIDLGSCERTLVKTTNSLALSLSSLGHVIMAIVNNSKNIPFKESRLTSVLRELLGNFNCRAVMLAHVSRDSSHYSDTLSAIQMASRIHRVIKKKHSPKHCSKGDGYTPRVMENFRGNVRLESSSGFENTSGSELSCDTVVYVNNNSLPLSERELTDNEGPPDIITMGRNVIAAEARSPERSRTVHNIAEASVHLKKSVFDKHTSLRENKCSNSSNKGSAIVCQPRANGKVQSTHRNFVRNNSLTSLSNSAVDPEKSQSLDLKLCSSSITLASRQTATLFADANLGNQTLTKLRKPTIDLETPIKPQRSKFSCGNGTFVFEKENSSTVSTCSKNMFGQKMHQFTNDKEMQENVDCRSSSPIYENLKNVVGNYSISQDERPEPVGCAFDSDNNPSLSNDQSDLYNFQGDRVVPESLLCNLNKRDCMTDGGNEGDNDSVDVSLYCLTFATKSPLIPLSLNKFSQQIKNSFKKKSTTTNSATQSEMVTECPDPSNQRLVVTNGFNKAEEHPVTKRDDISTLQLSTRHCQIGKDKCHGTSGKERDENEELQLCIDNSNLPAKANGYSVDWENGPSEEEVDIPNIKPMPKIQCSYASGSKGGPESNTKNVSKNCSASRNIFHRKFCVYDSSSSQLNCEGETQSLSLSFNSISKLSTYSSEKSIMKETCEHDHDTSTSAVITKSKSSPGGGATLSIVKRQNSSGPTLELLITSENDRNCKKLLGSKSNNRLKKFSVIKKFLFRQKDKTFSTKELTNSEQNQKTSKHSGLRRSHSKKTNKPERKCNAKQVEPKEKSNLFPSFWPRNHI